MYIHSKERKKDSYSQLVPPVPKKALPANAAAHSPVVTEARDGVGRSRGGSQRCPGPISVVIG